MWMIYVMSMKWTVDSRLEDKYGISSKKEYPEDDQYLQSRWYFQC